jgi:hypothetical protein
MMRKRITRFLPLAFVVASGLPALAQVPAVPAQPAPPMPLVRIDQPDAQGTREGLFRLMQRYPPELRNVLSLDPSLTGNQAYLAPYPALASFLNEHPEIARNPSFYFGPAFDPGKDSRSQYMNSWRSSISDLLTLIGFISAFVLIGWLIRHLMDYRRWIRQNKVQTEVHTRLLERLSGNDELLAYIQSPAGAKFLESSPITLDAGPRNVGAPLGRILWTIQAGVVLVAGGVGLLMVAARMTDDAAQGFHAMGVLGVALGTGFMISAIISFMISRHLGLVELPTTPQRPQA